MKNSFNISNIRCLFSKSNNSIFTRENNVCDLQYSALIRKATSSSEVVDKLQNKIVCAIG